MSEIKIYNLRIVPPSPIYEEVAAFKTQFIEVFGPLQYSKSKPHITLVQFKMIVENEPFLIKSFASLSKAKKFKMSIEGFDMFEKGSNVLLLKVRPSKEFDHLLEQLKLLWQRDFHRELRSLIVSSTPHITISKTRDSATLHKSFELFKDVVYVKEFEVNELTLLSRLEHNTWDWEHRIVLG
ncbi:2'-5' RNA ligase family protein [Mangrovimonas sp. TPBH4]|uniref:2'-5' RNA ligase family protein n=1 Tax=Mangrovimonas sp. TPBH4 TaxID=1645914 RepID=UPI0006B5BE89|nr:2'-5' RNA ligase family protein [Mangrovimonas sp. TPBH4]